ncbi:MAG TPA: DUF2339 domain-containing protein [Acetobacteraceae bacterium]|nr:DUF2339 domain-containing protein [Acetobacteraceae bacterium]
MEQLAVLFVLVLVAGWFLGVIGFFKVLSARAEISALRRAIEALAGDQPAPAPMAAEPRQASVPLVPPPEPAEQPEPEPQPVVPAPLDSVPPMPEPAPVTQRPDIEALLTARWGVWLGAAALVLAGVFLVRYAVDQGLLGPAPRCVLAALLGAALIIAAEWLRRREILRPGITDQAAPGLAAGGVAVLFGAAYGAGVLYELVPPSAGFVLLAAASLIGLAISLRHGQLVAAVGILGAFVTPALVQTEHPSLPGLFGYLLFVTATALAVLRYAAWVWLGWATTIAGAVWVLLAFASGPDGDIWAPALFLPAAAALNLGLLPGEALDHPIGRRLAWVPCAVLGATGLLMAVDNQGWTARIAVLLFVPLTIWHAAREPRLRLLPFLAALLFLLLLAGWSVEIRVWPDIAIPPGEWTPAVVQELLATAALIAGCFAASGLRFERRTSHPLPWASLAASVPVLTLAVCYARVAEFRPQAGWAVFAMLLAVGLTGTTAAALREAHPAGPQRAGIHAAGAVAALALGCAMLLRGHWLTLAVSLFLPALAWVAAQVDLPALRRVALAVAGVVLIRLLLNWYVLDYGFGQWPVVNGLLAAYALPAAAFALAAAMFRRQEDDLTVGVLEAGSVALATVFVALEVRQGVDADGAVNTPYLGFPEAALHVASLAVLAVATMRIARRLGRPVLQWGWRIQGTLALAGGVLLILFNPLVTDDDVGSLPLFDWLLPAYLLPALLAVAARRDAATVQPPALRPLLGGYALIAGLVWLTVEVRHLFHAGPVGLDTVAVEDAELWAWSGAWLAYGVAVMAIGIAAGNRHLRLAALAIVGLTTAKVFLVDMSDLVGLWRVLSFLGLGLVLIGLGAAYRRLVAPPPREQT